MFELGLFIGVCALVFAIIEVVDRYGGEQDYSG
jgi:hypothetical protein